MTDLEYDVSLQRTLSGVHSIMMEKLAQAGEGVRGQINIQYTPPISTLPLYVTTDRSERRE
jgi:hypothetical protein